VQQLGPQDGPLADDRNDALYDRRPCVGCAEQSNDT
jgi:hypothetical protein